MPSDQVHRYDVFLSHNSADKPLVERLARKLRDVGLSPFLDKWHLIPGEAWQEALEEALDQSQTCAVFLGPEGIRAWHNEELRAALEERAANRDFRVIPVLLPGASMPERKVLPRFLRRLTWVDFRRGIDEDEAFHQLVSGVRGVAPGPGDVSHSSDKGTVLSALAEIARIAQQGFSWLVAVGDSGPKAIRGAAVLVGLGVLLFGVVRFDVEALLRGVTGIQPSASADGVYRVQVTVLGLDGLPTEGVSLSSSPRGQIQEGGGGWEIIIPSTLTPEGGRLTVWATKRSAFLSGEAEIPLGEDLYPTLKVQLKRQEVEVRGRVVDLAGQGVPAASVAVAGYDEESVETGKAGGFVLPAHAADGQLVRLRVEAEGYRRVEEEVLAGAKAVTILLEEDR